jgi:hypothetical protein
VVVKDLEMNVSLRLYKAVVHIPTSCRVPGHGFWVEDVPFESVPVERSQELRQAILTTIERGNPSISLERVSALRDNKDNPRLKAMGVKSWHVLDRGTTGLWSITDRNGTYEIRVNQPMKPRGWHEDKTKRVDFPVGTPIDEVITRLIAMIQECARR